MQKSLPTALCAAFAVGVAAFGGCAPLPPPHRMVTPFNEADFAPYDAQGTASITGQAFLKTQGGEVRYGAGDTVRLIPATPYNREFWQAILRGDDIESIDPRWKSRNQEAIADGQGNFEFTNLPAGVYFLECAIFWKVPCLSYSCSDGMESTGSVLKFQVKIADGEKKKIIMTE